MEEYVGDGTPVTEEMWYHLRDSNIVPYLTSPEKYIGDAVILAQREAENKL